MTRFMLKIKIHVSSFVERVTYNMVRVVSFGAIQAQNQIVKAVGVVKQFCTKPLHIFKWLSRFQYIFGKLF